MRQFHKAGVALLAVLAGIGCGTSALAQGTQDPSPSAAPVQGAQVPQAEPQQRQGMPQGHNTQQGQGIQQGGQKGLGAGIGGQAEGAQGACEGKTGGGFSIAPLETGGGPGVGAGIGEQGAPTEPSKASAQPAPVPQYWLADASLFVANAGNAAQTLANEQTLGVQAPSVLGNQAQFLLASTDRALSSLTALLAHAEATNPRAVPEIRAAMNELVAAKAQAQQTVQSSTLGPAAEGTIRSTYDHLQAAERDLGMAARAYGAQGFALASVCAFHGRGLGAGVGGKAAPATPQKKAPPEGEKSAPGGEKSTPPGGEKGAPGGEQPGGNPQP